MGTQIPNSSQIPAEAEASLFFEIFEKANQAAALTDPRAQQRQCLKLILETCGAIAGVTLLKNNFTGNLVARVERGYPDLNLAACPPVELNQTLINETIRRGYPLTIDNLTEDSAWLVGLESFALKGTNNVLSLPMYFGEELLGVFLAFNYHNAPIQFLQLLANRLASDIEKASQNEIQQSRINRLNALIAVLGQIGTTLDRDQILRMIINYAPVLLNAEASSLFLADPNTDELVLYHASNNQNLHLEHLRVPAGKGIIGTVVQTGQTIIVNDVKKDERHYGDVDQSTGFVTRSILAVPLTTRQIAKGRERGSTGIRTIGGLEALNKLDSPFTEEDAQLFRSLANQAATVLQVADLYTDRNELLEGLLEALTAAIDAKDPFTENHSRRVRDFSMSIAEELGLLPDMHDQIWIGSLLHDIGKIGIPDAILGKRSRLNPEEYHQIKQHPTIGKHILNQVRQLRGELAAIAEHHEHLDGSGYPNQLKGEQISITARIVAVADVFDAMTSDRPYRNALSVEDVFEYLKEVSGKHLDGECVRALIDAYLKGKIMTQKMREVAQTKPLRNTSL
jgi:HD-GYP domain-containing protein (c-di-GMP phosphodiesterase class II)